MLEESNLIRRYTTLSSLFDILRTGSLTLLTPEYWDDQTDRRLMEGYREQGGWAAVFALCFSAAGETYHHWKVFSPGMDGVCIVLDKAALTRGLQDDGISVRSVEYITLGDFKKRDPCDFPFLKRNAYANEEEFRVVYSSRTNDTETHKVPIGKSVIKKVFLSPWLPEGLFQSVKEVIRSVEGFERLAISHSKVTDSPGWRRAAERQDQPPTRRKRITLPPLTR